MKYYYCFLFATIIGCTVPDNNRCIQICQTVENSCNEFELEDCISECNSLPTTEAVSQFETCAICYMDNWCDPRAFQIFCYPEC